VLKVDRLEVHEEPEWDAFLRGQQGGLFVHSIAYRNLLAAELGCKPEYLVAREAGEIRGVLPLMWSAGGRVRLGARGPQRSADLELGRDA
jgi:CelD/BcsL family acetyltransferase involved in cellulose biosynthesis